MIGPLGRKKKFDSTSEEIRQGKFQGHIIKHITDPSQLQRIQNLSPQIPELEEKAFVNEVSILFSDAQELARAQGLIKQYQALPKEDRTETLGDALFLIRDNDTADHRLELIQLLHEVPVEIRKECLADCSALIKESFTPSFRIILLIAIHDIAPNLREEAIQRAKSRENPLPTLIAYAYLQKNDPPSKAALLIKIVDHLQQQNRSPETIKLLTSILETVDNQTAINNFLKGIEECESGEEVKRYVLAKFITPILSTYKKFPIKRLPIDKDKKILPQLEPYLTTDTHTKIEVTFKGEGTIDAMTRESFQKASAEIIDFFKPILEKDDKGQYHLKTLKDAITVEEKRLAKAFGRLLLMMVAHGVTFPTNLIMGQEFYDDLCSYDPEDLTHTRIDENSTLEQYIAAYKLVFPKSAALGVEEIAENIDADPTDEEEMKAMLEVELEGKDLALKLALSEDISLLFQKIAPLEAQKVQGNLLDIFEKEELQQQLVNKEIKYIVAQEMSIYGELDLHPVIQMALKPQTELRAILQSNTSWYWNLSGDKKLLKNHVKRWIEESNEDQLKQLVIAATALETLPPGQQIEIATQEFEKDQVVYVKAETCFNKIILPELLEEPRLYKTYAQKEGVDLRDYYEWKAWFDAQLPYLQEGFYMK